MINIFSTSIGNGKGGISTALVGYVKGLKYSNINFRIVSTHHDKKKLKYFFKALELACKIKKNEYCWFHCGPWFSMLRKLFFILICKVKGGEIIIHFHSPKIFNYVCNKKMYHFVKLFILLADKIVVVAPWWKELLSAKYPKFKSKIFVSLNPLDEKLIQLSNDVKDIRVERENNNVIILSVSRLVDGKGVDKTIKALTYLPQNFQLNIAGIGPQENELKELVKTLNLSDRVKFLGWVSYDEKIRIYKNADIFCLPSKLDSFGMVYLEAMLVNLPVVALNFQAIPNILPDKESVILLNDDSPEQISKTILKISKIKNDGSLSDYVISKFNKDLIVNNFIEILNEPVCKNI